MIVLFKVLFSASMAMAASAYPPVSVLEQELHAAPGVSINKLVPWNGRLFQPYYVKSVSNGKGEYLVTIRLR